MYITIYISGILDLVRFLGVITMRNQNPKVMVTQLCKFRESQPNTREEHRV